MELRRNSICSRLMAYSSPVRSRISLSSAKRRVRRFMSSALIAAFGALPRVRATTARRFASGMMKSEGSGIGTGVPTGGVNTKSSEFSADITSLKFAVHTSRFTFPPLNKPVSPKLCKLDFSRISFRSASVSNPTDAAARDAFSGFWNASWNRCTGSMPPNTPPVCSNAALYRAVSCATRLSITGFRTYNRNA